MRWISARASARALAAALVLSAAAASGALAHEGRESAGYDVVVGFLNEPAYEGYLNAVFLEVTRTGSQAGAQEPHDMAGGQMPDVMAHGGIFVSAPFEDGDEFEAEIPPDLDGMTIPYHSHLNPDIAGSIEVSRDAPAAGRAEIELNPDGAAPQLLRVQPGATVVFLNRTGEPQLVASGMHTDEAHAAAGLSGAVTGLEDTLQVEVTHISSGQSTVMALAPLFEHPGAYTADFIPTQPGGYRFRFSAASKVRRSTRPLSPAPTPSTPCSRAPSPSSPSPSPACASSRESRAARRLRRTRRRWTRRPARVSSASSALSWAPLASRPPPEQSPWRFGVAAVPKVRHSGEGRNPSPVTPRDAMSPVGAGFKPARTEQCRRLSKA